MSEQNNNENLSENENNATITPDDTATQAAGAVTPEDTASFEKVIEQQNNTIETLLKQVNSLNDQIARYVRNTSTPANDDQANTSKDLETRLSPGMQPTLQNFSIRTTPTFSMSSPAF